MGNEVRSDLLVVDGMNIHVYSAGAGKPVVLIHGLGAPQMWERVIGPLSTMFRVIAVDLPGFGGSDCPREPFSTDHYAAFLDRLLNTMDIFKANVVGISYGGQIAATLTHRFPKRVGHLVLVACTGLRKPRWFARNAVAWNLCSLMMKYTVLNRRSILALLSRRSYFDITKRPQDLVERFFRQLAQPGRRDAWLNALRNVFVPDPEFRQMLSAIRRRTLIVWGADDHSVPLSTAHEVHRLIPHSSLHIISECGHSVPWEQPVELSTTVGQFISSASSEDYTVC